MTILIAYLFIIANLSMKPRVLYSLLLETTQF